MTQATDAAEIIPPARDGALRVLRAARDAGVSRVVLTSLFAAFGYGAKELDGTGTRVFDESAWTDPATPGLPLYPSSDKAKSITVTVTGKKTAYSTTAKTSKAVKPKS